MKVKIDNSKLRIKNSHPGKQKFSNLKARDQLKSTESADFYSTRKQDIIRDFQNLENFNPKYRQTFTELQLEYLQLCENLFKSSILFQSDITKNLNYDKSFAIPRIITETIESTIKSYKNRNEMILSSMESFKDIIRDWNEMFISYSDVYKEFYFKKS